MKKASLLSLLLSTLILVLNFLETKAQDMEGDWKVVDYTLKKKFKDADKQKFVISSAKETSFRFNKNELTIYMPMLSRPTKYDWKFIDKNKTIIEAIEKGSVSEEYKSRWKLQIIKKENDKLFLKDLIKGKKGNVWILTKE